MSFLVRSGDLERLVPLRAVAALGHNRLEVDEGAVEQDLFPVSEKDKSEGQKGIDQPDMAQETYSVLFDPSPSVSSSIISS